MIRGAIRFILSSVLFSVWYQQSTEIIIYTLERFQCYKNKSSIHFLKLDATKMYSESQYFCCYKTYSIERGALDSP